jgi:membrane protein YqaA with SNARE-associated domain
MVLEFLAGLEAYGYIGAFVMSVVGSATIIFPVPYFIVIFGMAGTLNPVLLTLAASVGSAIGELTGFWLGKYGSKALIKKKFKWLKTAEKWFDKNGFLTLVFFAAAPLPTDIGGIIAGTAGYSRTKFFIAMLIGKTVKFAVIVYAGYYSLRWVLQYVGL